jgi:hypothetical protein
MLAIDVFQSYSTIVTPNEAIDYFSDANAFLSTKDSHSNENQEV